MYGGHVRPVRQKPNFGIVVKLQVRYAGNISDGLNHVTNDDRGKVHVHLPTEYFILIWYALRSVVKPLPIPESKGLHHSLTGRLHSVDKVPVQIVWAILGNRGN